MCDSESEEFASADEDFEEIEPDELEEVLQSTKPSDVSSKKKAQHPSPTNAANIDVEAASKTTCETKDVQLAQITDPLVESNTCDLNKPASNESTVNDKEIAPANSSYAPPNETVNNSKKLVLKPPKPQMLEQVDSKETDRTNKEEIKSDANEGWDDFDDDWGDFTVESGDSVVDKQTKNLNKNTHNEKLPAADRSAKTSFRDVDIDEVEHKLKDFMKHKDDPPLTSVLDRLSMGGENKATDGAGQSWGSWKPSWGGAAVSFLSNASKSVASITTNLTQVIESGIGVPNPEELARRQAEAEAKLKSEGYIRDETESNDDAPSTERQTEDRFGFDQLVSGVTQISSKVITGGLDTLEGIGKKTMTILQENDPGLLNKRKLLGLQPNDGVVLSQVLREAKAKTEERERNLKQIQKHQYKKKLHFETLFDDYHGLVHLEALEMLSKQASLKLESLMAPLTGKALEELQETMSEVNELCELPETDNDDADGLHTADELEAKLKETIVDLDPNVKVDFGEIVKSWTEYTEWIDNGQEERTGQDVFEKAMRALAQTTALCVLRMHKLAEILLISEHHSTATEADVLVQLTTVFCWHLSGVATRFCSELTKMKDESGDDNDSALITNIFLEGSNSTSYIQNAFQLLIPILQLGAA
uniref:Protein FAM114A2 n=1 Tax=Anopheles culicifacies TaxID=139723 RepID=A0A182MNW1_9DIPT